MRRPLGITLALAAGCSTPAPKKSIIAAYPFWAASYDSNLASASDRLTAFPPNANLRKIALPFPLGQAQFGPDGMSIYGTNIPNVEHGDMRANRGLARIDFEPVRATPVPGTAAFYARSFSVAVRQDKLILSGDRTTGAVRECGVFEIDLPLGKIRQVLRADCDDRWSWDNLSSSPDGNQAIATAGSKDDLHVELLDLVHGSTRRIAGDFRMGVWSPNGKWIAMLGDRNDSLSLVDANRLTQQRSLGRTTSFRPEWSPDSRYLLLGKYLSKCGFFFDIEPPATLELLDVESGKRSEIQSSECKLVTESIGWLSTAIVP